MTKAEQIMEKLAQLDNTPASIAETASKNNNPIKIEQSSSFKTQGFDAAKENFNKTKDMSFKERIALQKQKQNQNKPAEPSAKSSNIPDDYQAKIDAMRKRLGS